MKRLLLFLLLSLPLNAQWSNSVFVGAGDNSGLGYTSPTYFVGTEIRYQLNSFDFSFDGNWSPNKKVSEDYGWSGSAFLNTHYIIDDLVYVGVCVNYSYTKAPLWSKSAFRPCAEVELKVVLNKDFTLFPSVKYILKGTDRINQLTGLDYDIKLIYAPYNIFIGFTGGAYNFNDSNNRYINYDRTIYGIKLGYNF